MVNDYNNIIQGNFNRYINDLKAGYKDTARIIADYLKSQGGLSTETRASRGLKLPVTSEQAAKMNNTPTLGSIKRQVALDKLKKASKLPTNNEPILVKKRQLPMKLSNSPQAILQNADKAARAKYIDDLFGGTNRFSKFSELGSGVAKAGTKVGKFGKFGGPLAFWLPIIYEGYKLGAKYVGEPLAENFPTYRNIVGRPGYWVKKGMSEGTGILGWLAKGEGAIDQPLFKGGPSLRELGFEHMPSNEYELAELRSLVAQYGLAQKRAEQEQQEALNRLNEEQNIGNVNTLDSIDVAQPQGIYKTPGLLGGSAAEQGTDSIGRFIRNNAGGYDGNVDLRQIQGLPPEDTTKIGNTNQRISTQAPNNTLGYNPVIRGEGDNTTLGGGISADAIEELPWVKPEIEITHKVGQQQPDILGQLTGAAANIDNTYDDNFARNLSLARLAAHRKNPYYGYLIDKGTNKSTANLQARAYQTELAKLKLINEMVKQQNAQQTNEAGLRGRAIMLMNAGLANNYEDALDMAAAEKAFAPYFGYAGKVYGSDTGWNKEVLKQQQETYRKMMEIRSREAIASVENRFRMTPSYKTAKDFITTAIGTNDEKLIDKAISMVKIMIPDYFTVMGSEFDGPSEDMFVGN